jgi:hypothetical protein
MPCNLTENLEDKELDLNAVVYTQLQLLLLLNNNEKTEFIMGFEKCVQLVEKVLLENNKKTKQ